MAAKSAKAFFHDDGRICLLYSTSNFWEMRSISMNADSKDHFVFDDIENPGFVLIVLNFIYILLVSLVLLV
jgi:hypothetical protein